MSRPISPLLAALLLLLLLFASSFLPPAVLAQSQSVSQSRSPTPTSSNLSGLPTATPTNCPACNCFTCASEGCNNFGECSNGQCKCPEGLGGKDCGLKTCNSTNVVSNLRSPIADKEDCKCDDGFSGLNCNICTKSDACQSTTHLDPSEIRQFDQRICNSSPRVFKNGHMYCLINEPTLKGFYPGLTQVTAQRNVKDKSLIAQVWYEKAIQFSCKMSDCVQKLQDGKLVWECPKVSCKCMPKSFMCGGGGPIPLTEPLRSLSGSFILACPYTPGSFKNMTGSNGTVAATPSAANTCSFRLTDLDILFQNGLTIDGCTFGECAYLGDAPTDEEMFTTAALSAGEIAGIGIVSVAGVLGLGALLIGVKQQKRMKNAPQPPVPQGVTLAFANLTYVVTPASKKGIFQSSNSSVPKKTVLDRVSGSASPGKLMAIMGPSGAGKSSFLDILAQKKKRGQVSGTFVLDGEPARYPSKKLKMIAGYVDQEDVLSPHLTVYESLLFSARTRLPESMKLSAKKAIVDNVLKQLGLWEIRNSRIGGSGTMRGISGGEKRRVSIGIELVTSPSILFLDEPTSGLDSYNAHLLLDTLSKLAKEQKKTVVCTIHQPRSDIFNMFDDLIVLAKGEVVYNGIARDAEKWCETMGKPCPRGYNVADHLIDLAIQHGNGKWSLPTSFPDVPVPPPRTSSRYYSQYEMSTFSDSEALKEHMQIDKVDSDSDAEISKISPKAALRHRLNKKNYNNENIPVEDSDGYSSGSSDDVYNEDKEEYATSFLTQLVVLSDRNAKVLWRNPRLLAGHAIISIILGALIGGLYFRSPNTLAGLQNRFGSIFFLEALLGFSSLSALGTFVEERILFLRERGNRCYHPMAFYLTKVVFDIFPLRVIPTILMTSIAYFMIGFQDTLPHYFRFLVIMILFNIVTALFCLAVASYVKDVSLSNLAASIVMLFAMLFGGILINQGEIPAPLKWIQYLSFFRYSTEALTVNEVNGLQITDNIGGVEVNVPGALVLQKLFNFDINGFARNMIILALLDVIFLILVGVLVQYRLKEIR